MAGTRSPAVFTDLLTAQSILGMDGELNQVSLAFDDALDESELRRLAQRVEEVMNDVMTAEDAGTVWTVDEGTSSLTISSTLDLQRVSGEDVAALRENRSTLYPSASLLEVLQVPLIDVVHNGSSLLTLADGTVSELRAAPKPSGTCRPADWGLNGWTPGTRDLAGERRRATGRRRLGRPQRERCLCFRSFGGRRRHRSGG